MRVNLIYSKLVFQKKIVHVHINSVSKVNSLHWFFFKKTYC